MSVRNLFCIFVCLSWIRSSWNRHLGWFKARVCAGPFASWRCISPSFCVWQHALPHPALAMAWRRKRSKPSKQSGQAEPTTEQSWTNVSLMILIIFDQLQKIKCYFNDSKIRIWLLQSSIWSNSRRPSQFCFFKWSKHVKIDQGTVQIKSILSLSPCLASCRAGDYGLLHPVFPHIGCYEGSHGFGFRGGASQSKSKQVKEYSSDLSLKSTYGTVGSDMWCQQTFGPANASHTQ